MKKIVFTVFTIVLLAAVISFVTGGTLLQDTYDWAIKVIENAFKVSGT